MYLPRTPPPNSSNSEPGVAVLYNVPSALIDAQVRRYPEGTLPWLAHETTLGSVSRP